MTYPSPTQLLLLDIETVSQQPAYEQLSSTEIHLWEAKNAWHLAEGDSSKELYKRRAAILAEFGKVVCISAAYFRALPEPEGFELRVKSFYGVSEKGILSSFFEAVAVLSERVKQPMALAGHNIREFDIPYLCRRALVNRLPIPAIFNLQQQKPWEVNVLDTLQLWRFGDYKHYTSLALLAHCFGIESPKNEMDGSMVGDAFWERNDHDGIAAYCEKDVVTTARVLHYISAGATPLPGQITRVEPLVFLQERSAIEEELQDDLPFGIQH